MTETKQEPGLNPAEAKPTEPGEHEPDVEHVEHVPEVERDPDLELHQRHPELSEARLSDDAQGEAPTPRRRRKILPPRLQAEPPEPARGAAAVLAALRSQRIIAKGGDARRLAELYLEENRMHGLPAMVRWAGSWWRFEAGRYRKLSDEELRNDLWRVLDRADTWQTDKKGERRLAPLAVTSSIVNSVAAALGSVMPSHQGDAPQWLDRTFRDPDPAYLVPCKNGVLDLRERELLPMTPRMFATSMVAAPWRRNPQPCPQWLTFLGQVWGDDVETIQTLQELFGYVLSTDTSQQKLFAMIGPKRSGKGTIGRVLKALLGEEAVVNPTISGFDDRFGLAPLIGKSLAVLGDARIGPQTDQARVVERLLSLSGEDPLTVDQKFREPVTVRLRTRVLLISNEVPRLYDTGGALASRFILLRMTRTFYGKEDLGLEAKLVRELPGIFQWAVAGWASLQARGYFVQPAASAEAIADLEATGTPHLLFVREVCALGPAQQVAIQTLYERWADWCKSGGREPGNRERFGADLKAVCPHITVVQPRRPDGTRYRVYDGIGLA
jgi:putative DNA primase/helicase